MVNQIPNKLYNAEDIKNLPSMAIVYKYNPSIQINGGIMYAFEYLMAAIDRLIQNTPPELYSEVYTTNKAVKIIRPDWFITFLDVPRKLQPAYYGYIEQLLSSRYPGIANIKDQNRVWTETHLNAGDLQKNKYQYQKLVCGMVLSCIKFSWSSTFLQEYWDKALFINSNQETGYYPRIKEKIMIQNRHIKHLNNTQKRNIKEFITNKETRLGESQAGIVLYEYQEQKLGVSPDAQYFSHLNLIGLEDEKRFHQYTLKIGFKYMMDSAHLKGFVPGTDGSKTQHYLTNSQELVNDSIYFKPDTWAIMQNYLHTYKVFFGKRVYGISYKENLQRWDENNRLIPEAKFFNRKIIFINDQRGRDPESELFCVEDSSKRRLLQDIKEVTLDQTDPLVAFLTGDISLVEFRENLKTT